MSPTQRNLGKAYLIMRKILKGLYFLLSMVIIQYNTMDTRTKSIISKQQTRKRTLRSASKQPELNNNDGISSADEKVVQEINNELQHQLNVTTSKTPSPLSEEQRMIPETMSKREVTTRSRRKIDLTKKSQPSLQVQHFGQVVPDRQSESPSVSLDIQLKSNQPVQLKEGSCSTPLSKTKFRNKRVSDYSAYVEERKSYRKLKRREISSVPYRKFQDQFEQRIVNLINKISLGKSTEKDIQSLVEKIQKISAKDLYNPYVISGLQTVMSLLLKDSEYDNQTVKRMKFQVSKLEERILEELGRIDEYRNVMLQPHKVNILEVKPLVIKKIYKKLTEIGQLDCESARKQSYGICEDFFKKYEEEANQQDVRDFIFKNFFF